MAEKTPARKRSTAKQQMKETLGEAEKQVAQRAEEVGPQEKLQARADQEAVAAAEAISTEGVVKAVADLKATVSKTLTQLADRLEEEVGKYAQIQRAVALKNAELQDIYGIGRSATTLLAMIEAQERKREQMETELAQEKEELKREIAFLRGQWEIEKQEHEAQEKERDTAETKRRQREQEEFRYSFARDQKQARDSFADEMAKAEKELAARQAQAQQSLQEREQALAAREHELQSLRQRAEQFPGELEAAVAKATTHAIERAEQAAKGRQELLEKGFVGEKNVLAARVTAMEQTIKEQAQRIGSLQQQADKAYQQVQEIAVRAIEGSAQAKQLASLQQLLTEQARKPA